MLLGLIPAADIAVNVVNQLVTTFLPPRPLPKLDLYEHGVPAELRTAVVIPTLFDSVEAVREALDNLEVQFLANREAHLHFAVLSDFTDAPTETHADDAAIVAAAAEGVRTLNARYAGSEQDAFYLFHRSRRWNPHEGVWMGWERKRGKLADFNRFVLNGAADAFAVIVGRRDVDPRTCATSSRSTPTRCFPPDAAPLLVGTLAHPLNRAVYDATLWAGSARLRNSAAARRRLSFPSAHRSVFASIHSGTSGRRSLHDRRTSDVYQDLYGEGSFTGKGAYEVASVRAGHARADFPENSAALARPHRGQLRAGRARHRRDRLRRLPAPLSAFTQRKHRWIRGDWQLLPWLTSRRAGAGRYGSQPAIAAVSLENSRQSPSQHGRARPTLIPDRRLDLSLPGSPLRWTLLGLGAVAAPWIVALVLAVVRPPFDKSWRTYYRAVGRDALTSAQQLALAVAFLPHQAWISVDAILRTLGRLG